MLKIYFILILTLFIYSANTFPHIVEKGEDLGTILFNQGIGPLWGKNGYVKKTIELNKNLIKKDGNLIFRGEEIKLPEFPIYKAELKSPNDILIGNEENIITNDFSSYSLNLSYYYLPSTLLTSFNNGQSTLKTKLLSPYSFNFKGILKKYKHQIVANIFLSKNKSFMSTDKSSGNKTIVTHPFEYFINLKLRKKIISNLPAFSVGFENENMMLYNTNELSEEKPLTAKSNNINSITFGLWEHREFNSIGLEMTFNFVYSPMKIYNSKTSREFQKIFSELKIYPISPKWSFNLIYQRYTFKDSDSVSQIDKLGTGISYMLW